MDVLDRFDKILSEACRDGNTSATALSDPTQCVFMCPRLQDEQVGGVRVCSVALLRECVCYTVGSSHYFIIL